MPSRKITVQLIGDSDSLEKAFATSEAKGKSFGNSMGSATSSLKGLAKAGAVGAAVGGVALLTKGLISSISAAKEAEVAETGLRQALKQSGNSFSRYGKEIDAAIQKTSKLAGIDDEELSVSFANLVRSTGSVTKAQKGMNLAANIARARNISLATATKAVERAYKGSDTALKRVGIVVPKVTRAYDALKQQERDLREQLEGATDAEKKVIEAKIETIKQSYEAARASDKQASAQSALDEANRKFAGSAAAYGKTAQGASERLAVAWENLQEKIGQKIIPVLTKVTLKLVGVIEWAEQNWPRFSQAVIDAWDKIRPIFEGFKTYFGGWVKIIQGIIEGDWALAWEGWKDTVRGAGTAIQEYLRLLIPTFLNLGIKLGEAVAKGFAQGTLGFLPGPLKKIFEEAVKLQYGVTQAKILKGLLEGGFGANRTSRDSIPVGRSSGVQPRQHGGPVSARRSYLVGENGPELLTMGRQGGFVTPNAGSIYVGTIHVHGVQNVPQLIAEIERVAKRGVAQTRGFQAGMNLGFG